MSELYPMKFHELRVGDVFVPSASPGHECEFVKIADNVNITDRLEKQLPNALRLDNRHYFVIPHKAPCKLVKSRTDFREEQTYDD